MTIEEQLPNITQSQLPQVGELLKAARGAKGLSLDDVANTLKVSRRVLEHVEANAWAELPGYTFARGIVRGYAKFVQLDVEPLLLEMDASAALKLPLLELPTSTRAALPVPGQSQGRDRLAMIAGVFLVASAIMIYFLVPEDWLFGKSNPSAPPVSRETLATAVQKEPLGAPQASKQANSSVQADPVVAPKDAKLAPLEAVAGDTVLQLTFDQTSWVEVKDKSNVMLLSENVSAGSQRVVNAKGPIELALGNADGVRVTYRGQAVDLKPHTKQKVARLSLE